MTAEVVDTNVLVVANGRETHARPACRKACSDQLGRFGALAGSPERIQVLLDDDWGIIREYLNNARSSGEPGVGDGFLLWVLTNRTNADLVREVHLTPRSNDAESFLEFPEDPDLAGFDRADRKFVAVAIASGLEPSILNATDSDWWDHRAALERNGVRVAFLCPEHVQRGGT